MHSGLYEQSIYISPDDFDLYEIYFEPIYIYNKDNIQYCIYYSYSNKSWVRTILYGSIIQYIKSLPYEHLCSLPSEPVNFSVYIPNNVVGHKVDISCIQ